MDWRGEGAGRKLLIRLKADRNEALAAGLASDGGLGGEAGGAAVADGVW